jgi:hypothetical protein
MCFNNTIWHAASSTLGNITCYGKVESFICFSSGKTRLKVQTMVRKLKAYCAGDSSGGEVVLGATLQKDASNEFKTPSI